MKYNKEKIIWRLKDPHVEGTKSNSSYKTPNPKGSTPYECEE